MLPCQVDNVNPILDIDIVTTLKLHNDTNIAISADLIATVDCSFKVVQFSGIN